MVSDVVCYHIAYNQKERTNTVDAVNIDLLLTQKGEPGLVADKVFAHPLAGVMYDTTSYILTLEFADMDALELNIPVEIDYSVYLTHSTSIHVATLAKGRVEHAAQVPLILLNDPFGGGQAGHLAQRGMQSVVAFEQFLKAAIIGQPVHRADLGNEELANSVMGGMNAALLELAPQLARQKSLEMTPQAAPRAPGLGLGGGGHRRSVPPPRRYSDSDD